MLDIWELYDLIKGPWSVTWTIFKDKPAETLTAILLFIGLIIDRAYRRKKAKIQIVKHVERPRGTDVAQSVDFRVMNTGGQEIHLRCYGPITQDLVFMTNDPKELRYESGFNGDKERILPGESVRSETYTLGEDRLLGVYVIDQTGRKWKQYLNMRKEAWHYTYKVKRYSSRLKSWVVRIIRGPNNSL